MKRLGRAFPQDVQQEINEAIGDGGDRYKCMARTRYLIKHKL